MRTKARKPYAILLRPFPREVGDTLNRAAQARGMSQAAYVVRLVDLHATSLGVARDLDDEDHARFKALLEAHGLGPVDA